MTKLRDKPTEVEQALAQDLLTFSLTLVRKGERQIRQTNAAVRSVALIEEPADCFTNMECQGKGEEAEKRKETENENIFAARQYSLLLAGGADKFFSPLLRIGYGKRVCLSPPNGGGNVFSRHSRVCPTSQSA